MAKRNLLLCFDAFGTLFKPARPVAQQYAEVARQCGITNFKDGDVHSSLLSAIKEESKQNPNYGKATGLGATKWWTNIIHNTFNPLIEPNQSLPKDLAPKLLHRFASKDGYDTEPNLVSNLKTLRRFNSRHFDKIVVGVVTNSDDRVPSILSSFGLNVSPLRYGTAADPMDFAGGQEYDIDFHCMSYDVGIEKPDKLIFHAADLMLAHLISIRNGTSPSDAQAEIDNWRKVYVGDEHAKDVVGAVNAGWDPVLLDEEDQSPDIPRLEDHPTETLDSLYKKHQAVRVRSLENLVKWFTADDANSTA
ncbi:haloacid dehalogenase [Fusarium albosuccineum]|uniref:Haloacid dehalogenase n=1 Tax=Fusarium albosuccineum TaxID=1237068 RepID=A0A8H4LA01_9HYPO|nr:haloacid dehalogenase [Fusarium albosuccineum]